MSFTIISTISPDFEDGRKLFVPSWYRNSGAEFIDLKAVDGGTWYENIILRNEHIRDTIRSGKRIVSLDLDCFVLDRLDEGFDGVHPIAVARWPQPNMGVLFLDGMVDFDWRAFFAPLIARITARCRNPRTWGDGTQWQPDKVWADKRQKGRFGDQYPWHDALKAIEPQVRKLDMNVWNFCYQPENWQAMLLRHQENVKIIHVKGRGRWEQQPHIRDKIDLVRRMFPEQIKE